MVIISRDDARKAGMDTYFTGKPCKHNHLSPRRVSNKQCIACYDKWREDNAERDRENKRQYYLANADAFKKKAREWGAANPEKMRVSRRKWRKNNPVWVKQDYEKRKDNHRFFVSRWRKNNPGAAAEIVRNRQFQKRSATPPWAKARGSDARKAMQAIYSASRRLQEETGTKHHVDHIIPLLHEEVCGLHVPANLQILTESENAAKWNNFDREAEEQAQLERARAAC